MKKLVVIVSLVFVAMAANAQMYVGGSLDFGINGTTNDAGDAVSSNINFGLMPEIGYYITDRFDVGLDFGFGIGKYKNHTTDTEKSYNSFKFAPYVRFSFVQFGGFELIGKGSAYINSYEGYNTTKETSIGVKVTPVLAYNLNDHFALLTGLNFASFGYSTTKVKDGNTTGQFGFGVDSNNVATLGSITIGCIYKF